MDLDIFILLYRVEDLGGVYLRYVCAHFPYAQYGERPSDGDF
jgi:hypothetical protein